jgi:hypothetical protein
MSTAGEHLASYRCIAAGVRALAAHVRDDHGWTIYTSEYEDYTTLSAMHQVAHENEQREPLCTCGAFHHPHQGRDHRRHPAR